MAPGDGSAESDTALARRLRAALAAWGAEPARLAPGRHLHARCLVGIGAEVLLLLHIEAGVPRVAEAIAPLTAWDFALRGTARGWSALWQDPPPPGWHDLFALARRGELTIEGRLEPFMANLQYVKDLLSSPRGQVAR